MTAEIDALETTKTQARYDRIASIYDSGKGERAEGRLRDSEIPCRTCCQQ